jgi:hypothetical protein
VRSTDELRLEIELLEKMVAKVGDQGHPGDDRLLQALTSLIADKQDALDGNS